ncbi:hypothetical protein OLZ31_02325 [Enterobacter asburiae]|nr:hypothetical protein [Enterobacter asburiae]
MKKILLSCLIAAALPSFAAPQSEDINAPVVGCQNEDLAIIEKSFNNSIQSYGDKNVYRLSKLTRVESNKSAYICTFIATDQDGMTRRGGLFVSLPLNDKGFTYFYAH